MPAKVRNRSTMDTQDKNFLSAVELVRDRVPSFNEYPFSLSGVAALHTLPMHPAVTFFVGENGTGKSTLLEAIAVGLYLNPEGGSKNMNFATRASHSNLGEFLRLQRTARRPRDCWFLRAESFYNVATEIDNLKVTHGYGNKSLHEQSHGESFFSLFRHRFGGQGM